MDHTGYALFQSIIDHEKFLGFNPNGKPINFVSPKKKIKKQCYKFMKRHPEPEDEGNQQSPQTIHVPKKQQHHHHHGEAMHPKAPTSNKLESLKSQPTASSSSSKIISALYPAGVTSAMSSTSIARARKPTKSSSEHHRVRHHHDQLPLRHNPNTISHKNNNNLELGNKKGKKKQPQQQRPPHDESLDNADKISNIYINQKLKNGVNIVDESENKENKRVQQQHHRHHLQQQQQKSNKQRSQHHLQTKKLLMNKLSNADDRLQQQRRTTNDELYDNHIFNDTNNNYNDSDNNCTYCTINNMFDGTMSSDLNSIESQMSSSAAAAASTTRRMLTTLWPTARTTTARRSSSGAAEKSGNHHNSSKNNNTHDKPNNHKNGNERRPRKNNANGRQSQQRASHQQGLSSHKQQHLQPWDEIYHPKWSSWMRTKGKKRMLKQKKENDDEDDDDDDQQLIKILQSFLKCLLSSWILNSINIIQFLMPTFLFYVFWRPDQPSLRSGEAQKLHFFFFTSSLSLKSQKRDLLQLLEKYVPIAYTHGFWCFFDDCRIDEAEKIYVAVC